MIDKVEFSAHMKIIQPTFVCSNVLKTNASKDAIGMVFLQDDHPVYLEIIRMVIERISWDFLNGGGLKYEGDQYMIKMRFKWILKKPCKSIVGNFTGSSPSMFSLA